MNWLKWFLALPPMIWDREADDHITKRAPFEVSVDEQNIGTDGLTSVGKVVGAIIDLPTIP